MGMKPEVLLKAFVLHHSKDGFVELVASTVDEVYSIALRLVQGPPHLVEETVLRVYWELARKAPGLGEDLVVATWLREHTCKTAVAILHAEDRSVDRAALKKERQGRSTASNLQPAPPGVATRVSQSVWMNVARNRSTWRFLLRALWPAWIRPVHVGAGIVCVLGILMLSKIPFHKRNPIVQAPELQMMTPASFGQLANVEKEVVPASSGQTPKTNTERNQNQQ
jgi:hypothetical protein